jgi:hypothetical protein
MLHDWDEGFLPNTSDGRRTHEQSNPNGQVCLFLAYDNLCFFLAAPASAGFFFAGILCMAHQRVTGTIPNPTGTKRSE